MPTTLEHRKTGVQGHRFDKAWTERSRQKVKATQILKRLQRHVLEDEEMSSSQIQAAALLLRKCLPDLTEHKEEVSTTLTIRLDPYAGAGNRIASRLEGEAIPGRPMVRFVNGDEESRMCVASEGGEGLDEPKLDGLCEPAESRSVLAHGAGSEAG